jgi:small subunit ribosomal protein S1
MSNPNEAPEVPAAAVEASKGLAPEGASTTESPNHFSAIAPDEPGAEPAASADQGEAAEGDEGEEGGEAGDEAAAGAASEGAGESGAKKKRRRRRRKKPGAQAGQEGGAPAEGGERPPRPERERAERPAKEGPGGVYARFFDGPAGAKRHAFTAGEVVAGRVVQINDGAFAVDLFGKATAFVDIFEPREVPVVPDPPPEAQKVDAPVQAEATSQGAAEGAEASPSLDVAAPAVEPSEAPASEAAVSEAAVSEAAVSEAAASEAAASEAASAPAQAEAIAQEQGVVAASPVVEASEQAVHSDEHAAHADDHAHDEAHIEHAEPEPDPEPPPAPELGSIFRGRIGSVAESGHVVIVNRIVDVPAAKKRLEAAREAKRRVRGVVYGFNRGGFDVLVEGIRVFCPASGMSLGPLENPNEVLGHRLDFTVPPSKAGTHGFVVSRRGILERAQRKAAKHLLRSLQPGQRLRGRVTQVREFGVFVDLGGIEGLVHQSELSFSRGVRPTDIAKIGEEIEVQVLRVGGEGPSRRDRERVSLSIKALLDDPWAEHKELLEPGAVRTGKVVRTTDFGAFIELAPQIEGLLHISELGRELKHANQALNEGDDVRVVIERVDPKMRRISLSKLTHAEEKAMEEGGPDKIRPPRAGQQTIVVVDKVEHAGLVVQVPGVFGRRGRGFIPNSEMGTERGTDHRKQFAPGTKIPVKIIGADRDGGLRCSRKALVVEEEKRAVQDYRREAARHGLGTFGDLLRAKLEGGK